MVPNTFKLCDILQLKLLVINPNSENLYSPSLVAQQNN